MIFAALLQVSVYACASPAVIDGVTLRCPGGPPLRLAGIAAPQPSGARRCIDGERAGFSGRCRGPTLAEEAREHLRGLIAGREVRCRGEDADPARRGFQRTDRQGRAVVRCRVAGGGDLSEAMAASGHAWERR